MVPKNPANPRFGPSRKPDSALSRHPSPVEASRRFASTGLLQEEPRLPARSPSRPRDNLACSHRWFTWPAPRGVPPVGSYPTLSPITCVQDEASDHRLVCSLLHLTWRGAYAAPTPRVVSPSGLSGPEAHPPALASPDFSLRPGRSNPLDAATGRTARTVRHIIPYTVQRPAYEPRPTSTIFVGLRRTSTLPTRLQRSCQRGSSSTAGSNQAPGLPLGPPSSSRAPS